MHKKLFAIAAITLMLTSNFYASPEQETQAQKSERLEKCHQKFMKSLRGAGICLASCAAIGATIAVAKKGDLRTGALIGTVLGLYPAVKISRSIYYATGQMGAMWNATNI